uniref:Uncharacterized protein n=1 Tax=Penaeus monodon majanivirus A TaxID=2984271 RepID=A0A9C7C576_9VIRU|nr:MAG: hypothetical protein [Penaeus monodon majanivirus A]
MNKQGEGISPSLIFKSNSGDIKRPIDLQYWLGIINARPSKIAKQSFPGDDKYWQNEENLKNFLVNEKTVDRVYHFVRSEFDLNEFRLLLRTYYDRRPLYVEAVFFIHLMDGRLIHTLSNLMTLTFNVQHFICSVVGIYKDRCAILKFIKDDELDARATWNTALPLQHLCYRAAAKLWENGRTTLCKIPPPRIWETIKATVAIRKIEEGYERRICMAEHLVYPVDRAAVRERGEHSTIAYSPREVYLNINYFREDDYDSEEENSDEYYNSLVKRRPPTNNTYRVL